MKKDFKYSINQGLPGGANELKKFVKGSISVTGYKSDSPDVNNDFNIIPSNRITMQGVNFPVLGVDDLGYEQMMMPGGEYTFPGNYVTEIPQMGKGGLTQWFDEKWVDVKTGKTCGRSGKEKGSRPYPACRPSKRVNETTPKTSSELSSAEKARFKREKTSGKRISYNHKRKELGGEAGWLEQYQPGGQIDITKDIKGLKDQWYTTQEWDDAMPDSTFENLVEFIDPTGITSYDDARVAYRDWKRSGTAMPSFGQGLEMFGAVPGLGKLSKLKYLANSKALKPLYKYFPWQQTLNAADTVQDEYEKKHGGWLEQYQYAGETSTAENPVRMNPIDIQAPQRSWFDRNIERPLRKFGRSYAQRISNATGGSEWYKQPNSVASAFFSTGPGFTLEAPQLSATYAVTGKVQTPSEAMNIQNPYGAFAVDMILDPIGAPSTAKGLVNLGRNLPKKLMRSAEIPKVSSVDDVVDLYRVQERNAKTFQQLADEGKLNKAFNNPQTLARKAEEEKYFGQWFTNNKKDLDFYIADREFLDPEIINLKIPRSELSKYSNYDKTLSRAPDREFVIPLSEQQKYINTPKNSFKSEIDWGKWNVDTPKYPELMNEYNTIEESTKKAGTWMKNPDGSSFQGTPEQFVQQQSSYFKKAFPSVLRDDANNVQFTYHGSPSEFDFFDGSIINHGRTRGHGIYTTPEVEKATGYAKGPNGKVYQLYQNAANKQDEYFKLKQASDEKFKQFLKDNPKDSPGFDKKFDDFVKEDGKTFDHLSIDEFKLRNGFDFYIAEPDEYVVPFTNYPKSAKGNVGFFDMTNPNIYKAVAPIGAGIGVGASQMQEKKYGGWLDSYQTGGELPELNSKMDVVNFYKNPLSEKYGIAQNPDTGSFEYYLKSGQSSDPIKQEVEELESQNLRKAYVPSLSEEVSRMSDVVLPEVKQQQSRSRNIEKTYELERQKDFIDSQLYNQPIGPQLDPTSLPIPSYSGMNPIQEYYANLLYDQYGKFVVTDKGENKTFYGTKTKDGDWDVNSFEVLTGRASDPRYQQVLKEELAQRRNDQYGITPIGVFPLSKKPNYYGSPGFKVEGSSLNPKVTVAYHTVFNPEKRLSLFENEDLADNYASSGCINCKKPNLEALINFVGQNGLSATIDSRLPLDKNIEWTKKNTPKYKKWLDNYK